MLAIINLKPSAMKKECNCNACKIEQQFKDAYRQVMEEIEEKNLKDFRIELKVTLSSKQANNGKTRISAN